MNSEVYNADLLGQVERFPKEGSRNAGQTPACMDTARTGQRSAFDEPMPLFPADTGRMALLRRYHDSTSSLSVPVLKEVCGNWLTALFGLPKHTAAAFTDNTPDALICALAAARAALCQRQGFDTTELSNAPRLRVVTGSKLQSSVWRALAALGANPHDIVAAPTDSTGRLRADALPPLDTSTVLIVQTGGTDSLAFDPLHELCDAARRAGAWVHVDGAHGLWAAASARHRHLVSGINKADSWSVDASGIPGVPHGCNIVLCRDRETLISVQHGNIDKTARTSNLTVLWSALRQLGAEGVAQLIDGRCDVASYLVGRLRERGFTIEGPTGFCRFMLKCETPGFAEQLLHYLKPDGICRCDAGTWNDEPVVWISVLSHRASTRDIERTVTAFVKAKKAAAKLMS